MNVRYVNECSNSARSKKLYSKATENSGRSWNLTYFFMEKPFIYHFGQLLLLSWQLGVKDMAVNLGCRVQWSPGFVRLFPYLIFQFCSGCLVTLIVESMIYILLHYVTWLLWLFYNVLIKSSYDKNYYNIIGRYYLLTLINHV